MPFLLVLLACGHDPWVDSSTPGDSAPGAESWSLEARLDEVVGSLVWLSWVQPEAGSARVEWLDGESWVAGPAEELDAGPQERGVPGIPFGTDARLRVVLNDDCSEPTDVSTAPLPEGLAHASLTVDVEDAWDGSVAFALTSVVGMGHGGSHTVVLDRRGRVVWALASPEGWLTMQPRPGRDGTSLLVDHNSFYGSLDGGEASRVLRIDLAGSEREAWDTPGLHHAFAETADGLAWSATEGDGHDQLALLAWDGTRGTLWDCEPFMAELGVEQACQANGVSWDEVGERWLLSFFSTNSVVELDAAGEPTRWFGALPGAWELAVGSQGFHWQHDAQYTAAGTLLLSTHGSALNDEIVAREYRLDDEARQLAEIASLGEGLQAPYGGSVQRLASGHTLHGTGSGGRIREFDEDGALVWEIDLGAGTYLGKASALEELWALLP
jgi:hypothetical protein